MQLWCAGALTEESAVVASFHPRCANPGCGDVFKWLAVGTFFRFPANGTSLDGASVVSETHNLHEVKHFWLCERCSHIHTLHFDRERGVIVQALSTEFSSAEQPKTIPAVPNFPPSEPPAGPVVPLPAGGVFQRVFQCGAATEPGDCNSGHVGSAITRRVCKLEYSINRY